MDLFISKKEQRRKIFLFRLKIYTGIIILILLAGSIFYGLVNLPFLKFKEIEIRGQEKLTSQQIINSLSSSVFNNYLAQLFGFDNFLSWPSGDIKSDLPLANNISIIKHFLNKKLEINVVERKKFGIWCKDKCYYFDDNGIIFSEASSMELSSIFKIKNKGDGAQKIILGKSILSEELFGNLKKIINQLGEGVNLEWDGDNFELKTDSSIFPVLIFSLRFDPSINLAALSELQKKSFFKSLSYVDLRVENRIFYK